MGTWMNPQPSCADEEQDTEMWLSQEHTGELWRRSSGNPTTGSESPGREMVPPTPCLTSH